MLIPTIGMGIFGRVGLFLDGFEGGDVCLGRTVALVM